MKNIHVLPTDKTARLHKAFEKTFILSTEHTSANDLYKSVPHNIYITSDEEFKIGYWVYSKRGFIGKFGEFEKSYIDECKKIILTTDQDLIKDGVQAIDDEFLEWFVKNPNCECVDVKYQYWEGRYTYQIIIPKEEPKQETLEEAKAQAWIDFAKRNKDVCMYSFVTGFDKGYKLSQERMYSEKEVYDILIHHTVELFKREPITLEDFWNKFKKK